MLDTTVSELAIIIPMCILGMFCWSIFIQGFWLVKTHFWERFIFLGMAFILVSPKDFALAGIHISHFLMNVLAIILMILLFFWHKARRSNQGKAYAPVSG